MTRLWNRLLDRFWVLPMLCATVAAGGALLLTHLDDRLDTSFTMPFLFTGGPESARALLSAIITSMISFTGLVFSITIVALQLTSSQFSPRVLRTFLRDWVNQMALASSSRRSSTRWSCCGRCVAPPRSSRSCPRSP